MTFLLVILLGSGTPVRLQASAPPTGQAAQVDRPAEAYLQFLLGRRLEGQGDLEGAIAAHRRAADLDPTGAEIRAELAGLYARQDRVREAIEWAEAALGLEPGSREAHRILGLVYAALSDQPAAARKLGIGGDAEQLAARAMTHLEQADELRLVDPALHYALGRLWLKRREFTKAVEMLRRLQDEQPGVSDATLMLADALVGAGQRLDAARTLEAALVERPDFVRARMRLAELYEQGGEWAKAAEQYGHVAERYPGSAETSRRRATALLRAGAPADARAALADLVDGPEVSASDLYLLFQAHRDLGDLEAAESTARRIITAEPDGIRGVYALAQVYDQRRDYEGEVAVLEPAVARGRPGRLTPGQLRTLLTQLGFAYQSLGQHERAIETLQEVRTLLPSDSSGAVYVVQAYLVAGRPDEAVSLAERAREEFRGELRLVELLAEGYRRQGDVGRGITLLEETLQSHDEPSLFITLAELHVSAGEPEAALALLLRGRDRHPDDPALAFQLASLYERSGRDDDAEQLFRAILARDPSNAPALNYLGYMLAERGTALEEAVALITRALARDPANATYLDSLGWAYFKLGKLDLAERNLQLAAKGLVTNSVVQDHLGDVLFELGRVDEAIAAWQRALDGDGESIERSAIENKIRGARKQDGLR